MSLLSFLFPRLMAPAQDDKLVSLVGGPRLLGRIIVLPHRYFSHARRKVPLGNQKGRQAAKAQANYESGYSDPEFLIQMRNPGPHPSDVSIWSWDRRAIAALTGSRRSRVIPEPLAREPIQDGARLVVALEGYEGEIWSGGKRIASRWWPEAPTETIWQQFVTGARSRDWPVDEDGRPLDYALPKPEKVAWVRNLIWVNQGWSDRLRAISPVQLVVSAILIGALPAGCEASRIVHNNYHIDQIEANLVEQKAASEPWLSLRRRALSDAARVNEMSAPGDPASLLFALMDLDSALGSASPPIERLDYLDGELRIKLGDSDERDVVGIVSVLEQSANWDEVRYDAAASQVIGRVVTGEIVEAVRPGGEAP